MTTVRDIIREACERNNVPELADEIKYRWNNRITRTFGWAYPSRLTFELSRKTWAEATFAQRREVVTHEVCHIIAWRKYGYRNLNDATKGHGPLWGACMNAAGFPAKRFHTVPYTRRKVTRVTVYCGCGPIQITKTRHTKMKNGWSYRCRICGKNLSQKQKVS